MRRDGEAGDTNIVLDTLYRVVEALIGAERARRLRDGAFGVASHEAMQLQRIKRDVERGAPCEEDAKPEDDAKPQSDDR